MGLTLQFFTAQTTWTLSSLWESCVPKQANECICPPENQFKYTWNQAYILARTQMLCHGWSRFWLKFKIRRAHDDVMTWIHFLNCWTLYYYCDMTLSQELNQWEHGLLCKRRCLWLKGLRHSQIAMVRQGPGWTLAWGIHRSSVVSSYKGLVMRRFWCFHCC